MAGKPLDKFIKVRHDIRMTSLNDVFSKDELSAWEKRVKKLLPENSSVNYFCELRTGRAFGVVNLPGRFVCPPEPPAATVLLAKTLPKI